MADQSDLGIFNCCENLRNKMEEFKVSVESLHTTRVKEINYEGEEIYQE